MSRLSAFKQAKIYNMIKLLFEERLRWLLVVPSEPHHLVVIGALSCKYLAQHHAPAPQEAAIILSIIPGINLQKPHDTQFLEVENVCDESKSCLRRCDEKTIG